MDTTLHNQTQAILDTDVTGSLSLEQIDAVLADAQASIRYADTGVNLVFQSAVRSAIFRRDLTPLSRVAQTLKETGLYSQFEHAVIVVMGGCYTDTKGKLWFVPQESLVRFATKSTNGTKVTIAEWQHQGTNEDYTELGNRYRNVWAFEAYNSIRAAREPARFTAEKVQAWLKESYNKPVAEWDAAQLGLIRAVQNALTPLFPDLPQKQERPPAKSYSFSGRMRGATAEEIMDTPKHAKPRKAA